MDIKIFLRQNPLPAVPSKPVRVGVAGLGFIAESCHLPALNFLQRQGWPVEVTGLCDVREERPRLFQPMFPGAQLFSSPEALIESGTIDAVILLTPPSITPELIKAGIRKGIAVFTEKPVSHDANELHALYVFAGKRRVPVQVGYNRRYQPLADSFLHDVRRQNELRSVEARLWRVRRSEPSFYTDTMVHALDFLEYAFGPLQVDHVSWDAPVEGKVLRPGVQVGLRNAAGLRCTLDVRPDAGQSEEIYDAGGTVLRYPVQGAASTDSEEVLLCLRGFVHQLAEFLRLAAGEKIPVRCTLDDARRTCELCERIVSQMHS